MQVVILAAGRGTRMGPLTNTLPKPMLPVADRPIVAHVADAAIKAGASELVITVGYEADMIRRYFGDERRGTPIRYAEQPDQRGTADALRAAAEFLDGEFAVLNGDNLYRSTDLADLFARVPAVGTYHVDDPCSYGVLVADGGVIRRVVEKPKDPPANTINTGAYTFPEDALDLLNVAPSERGELELTDVLERVIERNEVSPVPFEEWMDVGRPWELLGANEKCLRELNGDLRNGRYVELDNGVAGDVHPTAALNGNVVIEPGTDIKAGVVIDGPVLIRSGATIGPNAYVRGPTLVGPGARIGHAVEVKNSVMMADATIGHLSYVGDSVIGPRANLGAGTNVANLRHDDEPVSVTVGDERVSTGRRKFGTVVGPDVKTGIQTGINPGVTLSAGARTAPGEIVSRDR